MAKKRTTNGKSRRRTIAMANQPQQPQQPAQPQQGAQQTFAADPGLAQQVQGIDWSKIDWSKIGAILALLVQLLQSSATPDTLKAAMPGCPDTCCDHCHKAMILALNAAHESHRCCCDLAGNP
jgi:hypothetical protein